MNKELISLTESVGVLYGGDSAERDISLASGQAIYDSLQRSGVNVQLIDVKGNAAEILSAYSLSSAFIAMHGGMGEDGRLQALLNCLHIPYTGSRTGACAIAMNKRMCKQLWQGVGLPTAAFVSLDRHTHWSDVIESLGGVMVKPASEGSSIGMSIAETPEALEKAFALAYQYDPVIIAEQLITGREFTVAIVNDQVLPPIELKTDHVFYDYQAKYESKNTQYLCPCDLIESDVQILSDLALSAFKTLGCIGWGRVDFMQDRDGQFYLLEVNTVPGMTDHSLVPMAASVYGWSFDALVLEILSGASTDND